MGLSSRSPLSITVWRGHRVVCGITTKRQVANLVSKSHAKSESTAPFLELSCLTGRAELKLLRTGTDTHQEETTCSHIRTDILSFPS
jgi:hypothetical protein